MGRHSVLQRIQNQLGVKNMTETFKVLVPQIEGANSIVEACERVEKATDGKVAVNPIPLRKMLHRGIRAGRISKGTSAYAVANIPRGCKPGFSPKAAEAAEATA